MVKSRDKIRVRVRVRVSRKTDSLIPNFLGIFFLKVVEERFARRRLSFH